MYLLDTNVISELRKTKPHGAVLSWIDSVPESAIFLSAVTLGEIQRGIAITQTQNPAKARQISDWADRLCRTHRILAMDAKAFRLTAQLMHGKTDALFQDAMIAATAQLHHLTVVTRNVRDFAGFDVKVHNPFDA